jgi:tetratricopeptide (TPR) repeat protein
MSRARQLLILAAAAVTLAAYGAAPTNPAGSPMPPAPVLPPVMPRISAAPGSGTNPMVPSALAPRSSAKGGASTEPSPLPDLDSEIPFTATPGSDTAALPAAVIAKATARLRELVARQDALLADAGKKGADMDNIRQKIQTLIYDYDDYLRTYTTFAPGYVAYGVLLRKVGMRRTAVAMMMKANQLDPDLPIVKNQIGNYLAEEGRPVEAANYFLAAIRLDPKEPLYHYELGKLLSDTRDVLLKSGEWTPDQIDHAMQEAFKRASDLAPGNFVLAWRYAVSFYDVADPDWNEALKVWGHLEMQVSPGLEKDSVRVQAANILIKQKKFDYARLLLDTVTVPQLKEQKQKLLDELPATAAK